jgi:hypothetical protein
MLASILRLGIAAGVSFALAISTGGNTARTDVASGTADLRESNREIYDGPG